MSWHNDGSENLGKGSRDSVANGSTSYVQVPSSSPINVNSSPRKDPHQDQESFPPSRLMAQTSGIDVEKKRKLEAKRQAIRNHKDFPMVRRLFYYLDESAIFKGFVKGRGNLRDVTKWLTENYKKSEIIAAKEEEARQRREVEKNQRLVQQSAQMVSEYEARQKQNLTETNSGSDGGDGINGQRQPTKPDPNTRMTVSTPTALGSTNVSHTKPTVSILDKYKFKPSQSSQLKQLRLDGLFSSQKKRKLVRGTLQSFDSSNSDTSGATTPNAYPPALVKTASPKKTNLDVVDLDILEQKIKENRKRRHQKINLDERDSDDNDNDNDIDEDEDVDDNEEDLNDDSDGSVAGDSEAEHSGFTSIDKEILEFLNTSSEEDIIGLGSVEPSVTRQIIERRPFSDIYALIADNFDDGEVEEVDYRRKKKKTAGQKLVEAMESSLKGYRAIDSLIKQCSEYGDFITKEMGHWGVDVRGINGEIELVDVDETGIENDQIDDDEDDDDDVVVVKSSRKGYIKDKPSLLAENVELKNYQQVGINWIYLLYKHNLSCILADEMGLGKTCQVISFMALLHQKQVQGPHLVIVPSSTLENWLREFQKFCPSLRVQAYYGSQAQREDLRYELQDIEYDVMVTTYNLATGAAPDFKFLRHQQFNVIVYDEGHMLKNSTSERYSKLMRLKANFRLLLTGTPLQNNLKELVSLLSFMLPKLFIDNKEDLEGLFNQKVSTKNTRKDYNPLLAQQAITNARTMMAPFVLRRRKDQVLKHLPAKVHTVEYCEGSKSQMEIYDRELQKSKNLRKERLRRAALSSKEAAQINKREPIPNFTNDMMTLRKAALHPLLFRETYDEVTLRKMAKGIKGEVEYIDANEQFIFEDMEVMNDYELDRLCKNFPKTMSKFALDKKYFYQSGKVKKFLEIAHKVIESKGKLLLFSLFTQMLDILEVILSLENIKFLRLDGLTSVETRQDIIDQFYDDDTIPIFLLSTKAGGFGINLVVANHVVIFDQSFNPHDDKQAEDRAHRVGQEKEVQVHKLIVKGTIEENILQLAQNKLALDQSISADDASDKQIEEKAATIFESILLD